MRHGSTLALVPLWIGLALSPAFAGWTLPDDSRGHRIAPLLLLSRPDVREDLRLPPAMGEEVDRAIEDLFQKAAALKGRTGDAAIDARRVVDEGQRAWIERHLDLDQIDRLSQLDLRWEGPAALATRPATAEALSLSDEQKAALAKALAERKANRDKGPDADQRLAERVMATLNEGQKGRWERMLGRPFIPRTTSSAARSPTR